jgi:tetratricopeptide (TPR) repeat protein
VAAQVPLLLTTVPSNVRDLAPVSSLHASSLPLTQERQLKEYNRKIDEHLSYGEHKLALQLIHESRKIEPQNALLAYREAQCLERLGRRDEAGAAYIEAANLDGCRLRAPSQFAQIVRETASQHAKGVWFCDVAEQFRQRSQLAAPGEDFFLEHMHYNLQGHWTAALTLGEFIQTSILQAKWDPQRVPDDARRDALLGVSVFDLLLADTITLLELQNWPLNLAPDNARHLETVGKRIRSRLAVLPPFDQQLYADLSSATGMQQDIVLTMGSSYLAIGQLEKALQLFEINIARRPWDVRAYDLASQAWEQQGNLQRATEMRERGGKWQSGRVAKSH